VLQTYEALVEWRQQHKQIVSKEEPHTLDEIPD
jgi:hypothetical protein